MSPVVQNEANSGVTEQTQMENGETNGEVVRENQGVVSGGSFENRGDAVDEQRAVGIQIEEIVPKEGNFEADDSIENGEVEGNETLRNNQMDSSSADCEEGRSVKTAT